MRHVFYILVSVDLLCISRFPSLLCAGGLRLAILHIDLFFAAPVLLDYPFSFLRPVSHSFRVALSFFPFSSFSFPLVPFLFPCLVLLFDGGFVSLSLPVLSSSFPLVVFLFPGLSLFSPFLETLPRLSSLCLFVFPRFLARSFVSSVRRSRSSRSFHCS